MLRRWCILLAMLALTVGTAVAASSASAATTSAGRLVPGGTVHLVGARAQARGISNQANSTNWSGYAATTGTYTSVSASWTQPTGTCSGGDQYAAFWVGLDGYGSSTVEQTGSDVDCVAGTAQYYAWYEMYPSTSVNYADTVQAGDHITASVTYTGNDEFSLAIADTTQGWSHTTTKSQAGAARSSAEVIVEAPCCTAHGATVSLTNFDTVSFTSSAADGSALGSAAGLAQITMVDGSGGAKDSISPISGGNFSVSWVSSG